MKHRRVLVAPDSFKGTYSAPDLAAAIGEGLAAAGLNADPCPVGDGGEGTMDALLGAFGGHLHTTAVSDPLGFAITARFALLADGESAVVETAEASGLGRIRPSPEAASAASTYGTGELIAAALARGARRVLVTVGGSATTDGGRGAISAVEAHGGVGSALVEIICDVRVKFEDAALVFGPQKGADAATVRRLTARLHRLASALPRDPRGVPMGGCAGGLSGGLWSMYGARLHPGAAFVLDSLNFNSRAADATVVVTGEGRLDSQTAHGKLVAEVARRCRRLNRPVHAIVGCCAVDGNEVARLGLASVAEARTINDVRTAAYRLGEALRLPPTTAK